MAKQAFAGLLSRNKKQDKLNTIYTLQMTNYYNRIKKSKALLVFFGLMTAGLHALAQPLAADAGFDVTICAGNSSVIGGSPTATFGGGTYTYTWSPITGLSDPSAANPLASPGSTTTYTVSVTDNLSNTATDVVVVTVNALPTANAGMDEAVCQNSYTTFSTPTTSGASYTWNFGDGNTDTLASTGHVFSAPGTFTVTITGTAAGCTATDAAVITVNPGVPTITPTSNNPSCAGSCNGSVTLSPTGPYTYTWFGASSTTNVASGLCAGTYSVSISNSFGCSAVVSASVNSPSFITLTAGPFQSICYGDTAMVYANVTSGGVPPFTFTWNDGSTSIPGTDTMHFAPVTGTSYTVSVVDANGCGAGNSTGVSVTASTDISGQAVYSGGLLTSGINTAVLYRYEPINMTFDTVQFSTIGTGGDFHFFAVNHNNYLIEIYPDNAIYPTLVPTYYGDQYLWDSATVLSHGCAAGGDDVNVNMVEVPPTSGPGTISGLITEGHGFLRVPGEPIPGIDVKLGRNPGGQMVASTTTSDPAGTYTFTNVPLNTAGEHYTIYVDIPGLVRDSTRDVTIDATHTDFINQNYVADTNSIYYVDVTTGIAAHKALTSAMNVYPNPSNSNTTIEYSIADHANVSLGVYNVLGVKVAELANTEQAAGNYKYIFNAKNYNLRSGIYFITLITDGKANIQRLVITE
ncbi:MAG: hypothetical protein JWP12_3667 [Bacteroidetes bacterium]|nr:hypothetical protein [Bacteroidota bacterium]